MELNKSEEETGKWGWYDLKYEIAELLIPRLTQYKAKFLQEGVAIPNWVLSQEDKAYTPELSNKATQLWIEEIDKMILSFKLILHYRTRPEQMLEYDQAIVQAGLDAFAKYYLHFWD